MTKQTFYAADGVSAISAGKLSSSGTIQLTESEAMHDLANGRLQRQRPKKPRKTKPEDDS